VARTGLTAVQLYPLRSGVTVACLVAILVPYLAGLGLSRGLRDDAESAVRLGADLYLTGEQFGRPMPVPLGVVPAVREVAGVIGVTAGIVGRVELGTESVSAGVGGGPLEEFPPGLECIEGRLYRGGSRNELVVGSDLARKLHLSVGQLLPPFYH